MYPQPLLVTDLVREYADVRGGEIRFGVRDVRLHDLDSDRPPSPTPTRTAGNGGWCTVRSSPAVTGRAGRARAALPPRARIARYDYGIGWLALLAEAPPSADCVLFGMHADRFAGHMPRSPEMTRYYCSARPATSRTPGRTSACGTRCGGALGAAGRPPLTEGRLLEKRVLDMHNYVVEPMVFGRLFLAGDAAHLVAPIAAKGMNLALHDAFLLGDALVAYLTAGDTAGLDSYSDACRRRAWDYQEFSESGCPRSTTAPPAATPYRSGTTLARLRRLFTSPAAAAAFAEQYLGTADAFWAVHRCAGRSPSASGGRPSSGLPRPAAADARGAVVDHPAALSLRVSTRPASAAAAPGAG